MNSKRVLSILLTMALALSFLHMPQISSHALALEGLGTQSEPYLIHTPEDLKSLSDEVNTGISFNGKFFRMENDIDLSAYDWIPIGNSSNPFQGTFDGNGHTIRNLTLGTAQAPGNYAYAGLFGLLLHGAIKNLSLDANCKIYINGASNYTAGVAGLIDGSTVLNCENAGLVSSVSTSSSYVAGVVGYAINSSLIQNCSNTGTVTGSGGSNYSAGICAYSNTSNILNCYNTGEISGNSNSSCGSGGIAGTITNSSKLISCYNTGSVSVSAGANARFIGGITGESSQTSWVSICYNKGTITSHNTFDNTGGIVGYLSNDSSVASCYNTGTIIGNGSNTAGVAGSISRSAVINCFYLNTSAAKGNGNYSEIGTAVPLSDSSMIGTAFARRLSYYQPINTVAGGLQYALWGFFSSHNDGNPVLNGVGVGKDNFTTLTPIYYTITTTAGQNGTVTPSFSVNEGVYPVIYITPNPNSRITSVLVDGQNIGAQYNYIFFDIRANHTVLANFEICFEGAGSEASPFLIRTASDLIDLGNNVRNGITYSGYYFRMENDIDLSSVGSWTPIGNSMTKSFRGVFDGNGHVISNLKIGTSSNPVTYTAPSLFGYINGGTVENLGLDSSCSIYATNSAASFSMWIGANSLLINCFNEGSVTSNFSAGGIVGQNNGGAIVNCYNAGTVTNKGSSSRTGGIAQLVNGTSPKIINCYNAGAVTGGSVIGAITAEVSSGSVLNCTYKEDTASKGISIGSGTAVAKSTAEMKSPGFASTLNAYWDTPSSLPDGYTKEQLQKWHVDLTNAKNSGYPYLQFVAVPAVLVGTQTGTISAETAGSVSYSINTEYIPDGTAGTITWYSDITGNTTASAPIGITPGFSTVSDDSATLILTADISAVAGTYYFKVIIDGVSSQIALLQINPAPMKFKVSAGEAGGQPGGTVSIPVEIVNNPGVACFTIDITYDNNCLEYVDYEDGAIVTVLGGNFLLNNDYQGAGNTIRMAGASSASFTSEGDIVTLTFRIKANASPGIKAITVNVVTLKDLEGVNMPFIKVDGAVNVVRYLYGDSDGSGNIDVFDAVVILRYVAGLYDLSGINLLAADTDANGNTDVFDAVNILRYVAGLPNNMIKE